MCSGCADPIEALVLQLRLTRAFTVNQCPQRMLLSMQKRTWYGTSYSLMSTMASTASCTARPSATLQLKKNLGNQDSSLHSEQAWAVLQMPFTDKGGCDSMLVAVMRMG